eukprot:10301938-Alexandrium_andersonii.AAC.1
MSASLVGSEMCIRDSIWRRSSTGSSPPPVSPPFGRHRRDTIRGSTAPVSYTHLTLPTICSV